MKSIRCLALLLALFPLQLAAAGLESVYTDLDSKACKKQSEDKETGDWTQLCPGVSGYKLRVSEGDLRQSVTVLDPKGKEHPLDFYSVISGGFSFLGPKAEWRVEKQDGKVFPKALIVRLNASENPEDPNKKTSYLAVSKLTSEKICVTAKIPPGPKMNELAREAADASSGRPCLQP